MVGGGLAVHNAISGDEFDSFTVPDDQTIYDLEVVSVMRSNGPGLPQVPYSGVITVGNAGAALVPILNDGTMAQFQQVLTAGLPPPNVTDVTAARDIGSDPMGPARGAILSVSSNSEIMFIEYDSTAQQFQRSLFRRESISSNAGNIVSAMAPSYDSRVLVAVDGTPGELWYMDWDTNATVMVGTLEDSPRRVRCTQGGVCVVTNFGSGSLTVVDWADSVAGEPTIRETVAIGSGPVGVDLVDVGSAHVAVSTGFNDNSVHFTVIEAGSVRDESVTLMNCAQPGHASLALSLGVAFVSCNGDGTYAAVDVPSSVPLN